MTAYAISAWIVRDASREQALALLADSGFRAVELSGSGSALLTAWEDDCRGVVRQLAAAGLAAPSVHCSTAGRRALDSCDLAARLASIAANQRYLECMQESGVSELVLHPCGDGGGRNATPDERRALARDSLARLADSAGDRGLRIAVENGQKASGPSVSMSNLLHLIDGLGAHVGLCHDVGHSALAGLDPLRELRTALASGRLFSLHLHDVAADGSDHHVPGHGILDLRGMVRELDAAGFRGFRTVELRPSLTDIAGSLAEAARVRDAWLDGASQPG